MNIKGKFSKEELVLLSSIASLSSGKKDIDSKNIENVSQLLWIAALNGVEISFSHFLKNQLPINNSFLEKNILALERLKIAREELALSVQRIAQEHAYRILFIKSFMDFPYVDDDVDVVLIPDAQAAHFEEVITHHGFHCYRSRSQWREPNKRHYYLGNLLEARKKLLFLHLHFLISWNSMIFLDSSRVWERRREYFIRGNKIAIPSIEDEILIIAAHTVFENKHIKLWELIQFLSLLKSREVDWEYIVRSSKVYNWLSGLWLFLQSMKVFAESVGVPCPIPEKTFLLLMSEYRFLQKVEQILTYKRRLPFLTPFFPTLITFFHKFMLDFRIKNFRSLMRELIGLTVFDWVLYYRLRRKLWHLEKRE